MAEGDDEAGGGSAMVGGPPRGVWKQLDGLFRFGASGQAGDAELLGRFLSAGRDQDAEDAFAALVERHGPMVLGVCRRVLSDRHEAEDAFQATFLVLARRAGAIAHGDRLASWLHGVASRTALDARARADRRRARERRAAATAAKEVPPDDAPEHAEVRAILDEELARLPDSYRGPVILCELDGLSRQAAAERLGIPEGTLSSRLARAKGLLRHRLARRGLAPAAVAIEALAHEARAVLLPPSLAVSTIRAATRFAAGAPLAEAVAASVVTLTQGALNAMLLAKIKGLAVGLAAAAVVTTGVGVMGQAPPPARDSAPSDERLGAVEKKLDRILEALGGAPRGGGAGRNAAGPGSFPEAPSSDRAQPPRAEPTRPPGPDEMIIQRTVHTADGILTHPMIVKGDRPMTDVDERFADVELRLAGLERRLAAMESRLDQSSGVGAGPGAAGPPTNRFRHAPRSIPVPADAAPVEDRPAPKR